MSQLSPCNDFADVTQWLSQDENPVQELGLLFCLPSVLPPMLCVFQAGDLGSGISCQGHLISPVWKKLIGAEVGDLGVTASKPGSEIINPQPWDLSAPGCVLPRLSVSQLLRPHSSPSVPPGAEGLHK